MNLFRNVLKLQNNIISTSIPARNYAFKSDLKIKWNKPEKIQCFEARRSGDLKRMPQIDLDQIAPDFRQSKELKDADDLVKQLFTLRFQPHKKTSLLYCDEMMDNVRRHEYDRKSVESQIAYFTAIIRLFQDIMEKYPRNLVLKVALKELIERRQMFLKYLRRWDYKRFEWILEKLDIIYKPGPPLGTVKPTRKSSLRKLTDNYVDDIRQNRLGAFKAELEEQQPDFLREKIRLLEFIRNEQKECGVEVTVSDEEINDVKKSLELLLETRRKQENDD